MKFFSMKGQQVSSRITFLQKKLEFGLIYDQELSAARNVCRRMEEQLDRETEKSEVLSRKLNEFQANHASALQELEKIKKETEEILSSLQERLKSLDEENASLRDMKIESEKKLSVADKEIGKLRYENEQLLLGQMHLKKQIAPLQTELHRKIQELEEARSNLEKAAWENAAAAADEPPGAQNEPEVFYENPLEEEPVRQPVIAKKKLIGSFLNWWTEPVWRLAPHPNKD